MAFIKASTDLSSNNKAAADSAMGLRRMQRTSVARCFAATVFHAVWRDNDSRAFTLGDALPPEHASVDAPSSEGASMELMRRFRNASNDLRYCTADRICGSCS
jgi:hypothetical protein